MTWREVLISVENSITVVLGGTLTHAALSLTGAMPRRRRPTSSLRRRGVLRYIRSMPLPPGTRLGPRRLHRGDHDELLASETRRRRRAFAITEIGRASCRERVE